MPKRLQHLDFERKMLGVCFYGFDSLTNDIKTFLDFSMKFSSQMDEKVVLTFLRAIQQRMIDMMSWPLFLYFEKMFLNASSVRLQKLIWKCV